MRKSTPPPLAELMVHASGTREDQESRLPWVRWLFQSIRARCMPMLFQTDAVERVDVIADWQKYTGGMFSPAQAPLLLRAWNAARDGDDCALLECDRACVSALDGPTAERSVSAGALLLEQTRAAKHQGALSRFRLHYDGGGTPGHALVVWGAVAALFQLPPLDLLAEYLHEEWLAATQHLHHAAEPQGPLAFHALAAKALHAAGIHSDGFSQAS